MTKVKTEKVKSENVEVKQELLSEVKLEDLTYEEKLEFCSVIAKPMASKKLTKKCYKLIKKAAKQKDYLRNGLKSVQTRIRKGETGLVIFAGDITPIEIMCHLPAVCEDKNIPYVYIPSRKDLGAAMGIKKGCLMVLVRENAAYQEAYDELYQEIKLLAVEL